MFSGREHQNLGSSLSELGQDCFELPFTHQIGKGFSVAIQAVRFGKTENQMKTLTSLRTGKLGKVFG